MNLSLVFILAFFQAVQGALYQQCFPFTKSKDVDSSNLNIKLDRMTSVLIYNLLDTENANIPLTVNDEEIKRWINRFSVCGLVDIEKNYCPSDDFGKFTIYEKENKKLEHAIVNRISNHETLAFPIPYTGIWCTLLYQDGNYMQNYEVTFTQEFGHLSVHEYNEYVALSLVCLFELILLIIWLFKYNTYKKSTKKESLLLFKEFFKLIFVQFSTHLFLKIYLQLKNNSNQYDYTFLILSIIAKNYLFLIIFNISSGKPLSSFNDKESNLKNSIFNFMHSKVLYITVLILKSTVEILSRFLNENSVLTGISMVVSILTWLIIYKVSLYTMDHLLNSDELISFRRTRYVTFFIPIIFTIIKLVVITIYVSTTNLISKTDITSSIVKYLENKVHSDLLYSTASNLNSFAFGCIIISMSFIWEQRFSKEKL